MALTLTLTGGAIGRATRAFRSGTLSIGRGEHNDWVLPDPDRTLSKSHCVLSLESGRCVLTDLSTNGVFINGARTQTVRDSRTVLTDGDDFRLGPYTVTLSEQADAVPDVRAPDTRAPDPFGPSGADPLAMDPLNDPLADPLARPPDPAFSHPVRHTPAAARAVDPFDQHDQDAHRPPAPEADRFVGKAPREEWRGPAQPDHADAPRLSVPMPRVAPRAPQLTDIDFDKLIGDLSAFQPHAPAAPTPAPTAPPPRPAAPPVGLDDLLPPDPAPPPPVQAAPPPAPRPVPQPAPQPVPMQAPPQVARPAQDAPQGAGADAALRAFLEGAGVSHALSGAEAEVTLRAAGQVFRAMAEGLREVLMSRAALKGELRVEQTLLQSSNNNALKFSLSPEDAVVALLQVGRPGYMPPLVAAKEALHDIKTHEIAVVAGMQTALHALLARFDPQALEARLAQGKLSSLMPNARKAGLWDLFSTLYATIKTEAEDDFQAAFGRAFAKAYTAQTKAHPPQG